jgi:hypothetical protein
MKILQSEVDLASSRAASTTDFTRTSTEAWVGTRPTRPAASTSIAGGPAGRSAAAVAQSTARLTALRRVGPAAVTNLSGSAQSARAQLSRLTSAASGASSAAGATASSGVSGTGQDDPTSTDPELALLALLVEALSGHKIHLIKPGSVPTNADAAARQAGQQAQAAAAQAAATTGNTAPVAQPAGWGVDVQVQQVHQETETTAYTATGQVVTADGQTINFAYQVSMHRELDQQSSAEITLGDAVRKVDPIALNLTGGAVSLSDTRTAFDIDSDGKAEQVALPAAGTYFVALDRNGNGTIDNGSELFGPSSGSGFTELKSLDSDKNGWLDSGDAAYASLRLWSGPDGATQSLAQAGVGALYVGASVATQFDVRSRDNEALGTVVSSSVYMGENGTVGALQQVDLTA